MSPPAVPTIPTSPEPRRPGLTPAGRAILRLAQAAGPGTVPQDLPDPASPASRAAPPAVVEVELPGLGRTISSYAADLAAALRGAPIYRRIGRAVIIDQATARIDPITPTSFRTWAETYSSPRRRCKDGLFSMTMPEEIASATLASPQFLDALPELDRVLKVRHPVIRANGALEFLPPGYDAASRSYTIDSCPYDLEMPFSDAMKMFIEVTGEFPFQPDDLLRSLGVVMAASLTIYLAPMLGRDTLRPAFVFTANSEGAGKTLLVHLIVTPCHGVADIQPPPANKEETVKTLNTLVKAGSPYIVFDNWRGKIESPALEAFVTSPTQSGRNMGSDTYFSAEKECPVLITGNGATLGPDMRRRCLLTYLFVPEVRPEDRKIRKPMDPTAILERRADLLAMLASFVRNWDSLGRPKPSAVHNSFNRWSSIIGGIVEAGALGSPVASPVIDGVGDVALADFSTLTSKMETGKHYTPAELIDLARSLGLLELEPTEPDDDKSFRAERRSFGSTCRRYESRRFPSGLTFAASGKGHSRTYSVTV